MHAAALGRRSTCGDAARRLPGQLPQRRKARKLEGFLFPATYEFTAEDDDEAARRASSSTRSARNWAKVDLGYAQSKNLTPYDVLIIASMVEKETLAPEERPLVAP